MMKQIQIRNNRPVGQTSESLDQQDTKSSNDGKNFNRIKIMNITIAKKVNMYHFCYVSNP